MNWWEWLLIGIGGFVAVIVAVGVGLFTIFDAIGKSVD